MQYLTYLMERMFEGKDMVWDEDNDTMYVVTPAHPNTFDPEAYADYDRASVKGKLVVLEKDIQTQVLMASDHDNAKQIVHKLARHIPHGN